MTNITGTPPLTRLMEEVENHYVVMTALDGLLIVPESEAKEIHIYSIPGNNQPSLKGAIGYIVIESTEDEVCHDIIDILYFDISNFTTPPKSIPA